MSDLDALLDAAAERRTVDPDWADAEIELDGQKLTLRFTEMPPREWVTHSLGALPRPGVMVDSVFGFDVTAAAISATPACAVRVEGDTLTPLSKAQWKKLFDVIDSSGLRAISDVLLALNETVAINRLDAAKKVLEGAPKPKPPSPAK